MHEQYCIPYGGDRSNFIQYRFTDGHGKTRLEDLKHQVPASSTYALSLFGHCVMDGLQCWEVGAHYSGDLADYSDWRVREPVVKHTLNGVETAVYYYLKYFGFYNFHVLGMWQASRNKDIIEAGPTTRFPPNFCTVVSKDTPRWVRLVTGYGRATV